MGRYMVDPNDAIVDVREIRDDLAWVRPVAGGREWTVDVSSLRPPTEDEQQTIRTLTTPVRGPR
jgi:hypothetical protein